MLIIDLLLFDACCWCCILYAVAWWHSQTIRCPAVTLLCVCVVQLYNGSLLINNTLSGISEVAQLVPEQQLSGNMTNGTARQYEVQMNFTVNFSSQANLTQTSIPFLVGARVTTGNGTYTDVYLNGTLRPADVQQALAMLNMSTNDNTAEVARSGAAVVDSLYLVVDRSHAGGMTIPEPNGGIVTVPAAYRVTMATPLSLSLFIDHSVLEAFAQWGRGRAAARIYPLASSTWGVGVISGGTPQRVTWEVDAAVWDLNNMWLEPDC